MKNKQPQNFNIVRGLQKTTRRDAVLEKLLIEVDMKIKSLKYTCVRFGNNCTVGLDGIFQRSSIFLNKNLRLEKATSQIENVTTALNPVGCKCGSVNMWELSMFLLPINHVFGMPIIHRIEGLVDVLWMDELVDVEERIDRSSNPRHVTDNKIDTAATKTHIVPEAAATNHEEVRTLCFIIYCLPKKETKTLTTIFFLKIISY